MRDRIDHGAQSEGGVRGKIGLPAVTLGPRVRPGQRTRVDHLEDGWRSTTTTWSPPGPMPAEREGAATPARTVARTRVRTPTAARTAARTGVRTRVRTPTAARIAERGPKGRSPGSWWMRGGVQARAGKAEEETILSLSATHPGTPRKRGASSLPDGRGRPARARSVLVAWWTTRPVGAWASIRAAEDPGDRA